MVGGGCGSGLARVPAHTRPAFHRYRNICMPVPLGCSTRNDSHHHLLLVLAIKPFSPVVPFSTSNRRHLCQCWPGDTGHQERPAPALLDPLGAVLSAFHTANLPSLLLAQLPISDESLSETPLLSLGIPDHQLSHLGLRLASNLPLVRPLSLRVLTPIPTDSTASCPPSSNAAY